MKALAKFAMSGRRQAILAAVLLGFLPVVNFLSPPVVALVALRHGKSEAMIVLAWALLPALGWAILGEMIPLLLLLGITVLALVLHRTGSWETTLIASIGVGFAAQFGLTLQPKFLTAMEAQVTQLMEQLANSPELQGQMIVAAPDQLHQWLLIVFGTMVVFFSITLLVLARSWQAGLYNPGGFREEFHQLRLGWKVSAVLFLLFILADYGPPVLQQLALFFLMPLLVAGVALVHGLIGRRKLPTAVLVIFYSALISPVMFQILALAALADSWYDFRSRVRPRE